MFLHMHHLSEQRTKVDRQRLSKHSGADPPFPPQGARPTTNQAIPCLVGCGPNHVKDNEEIKMLNNEPNVHEIQLARMSIAACCQSQGLCERELPQSIVYSSATHASCILTSLISRALHNATFLL